MKRMQALCAALALKQNDPKFVLKLIPRRNAYVASRFLLLSAYTQLGKFNEAFETLRQTLELSKINMREQKPTTPEELVFFSFWIVFIWF